jgi:hypothetical protein
MDNNPVVVSEGWYRRQQGFIFYQNAAREAINLAITKGRLTFVPGMQR